MSVGSTTTTPEAPRTAVTIALANQKGGVGKTTTAVNLGVILSRSGLRVLLIDVDPQGNATSSLGVDKATLSATTYDVLVDRYPINRAAISTDRAGLTLIPSTPKLAGAEVELVNLPERERRLETSLGPATSNFDVILIDCPPSLGLLTVNALTAARYVIVPIQCEFLALEGVGQLVTTIDLVKRQLNPPLDIIGVLMTMYDVRTRLSANVVEEVRRFFPHRIFETVVPRSIRLAEAPSYGQSISEYDAHSRGAQAYGEVALELSRRLRLPIKSNSSIDASASINPAAETVTIGSSFQR